MIELKETQNRTGRIRPTLLIYDYFLNNKLTNMVVTIPTPNIVPIKYCGTVNIALSNMYRITKLTQNTDIILFKVLYLIILQYTVII